MRLYLSGKNVMKLTEYQDARTLLENKEDKPEKAIHLGAIAFDKCTERSEVRL